MTEKIFINGEMYTIFEHHRQKAIATARAEVARRSGLFKSIRVQELPKSHLNYKNGKWVIAIRGVARDLTNVTAQSLIKETGAPKNIEFNRRTGQLKNW